MGKAIDGASPGLVGLEIRQYKNLRDVWLPWSDGLAIFGVNGAGKTNLLECLVLLLGTDQTVSLAGARLAQPEPDALSVIARPGVVSLPWPPNAVLERNLAPETVAKFIDVFPPLGRAAADAGWWRMLGSSAGEDFAEGITSCGLPPDVGAYLADLGADPVVRYSLTRIQYSSSSAVTDEEAQIVSRGFARTLMADDLPQAVSKAFDELPDAFAPLRSHVASGAAPIGGWVPVLELPSTHEPPAVLQWLARTHGARGERGPVACL